jgi:hypothetical protein
LEPKKNNTARFDLFNVQFVWNLNPNTFNVYRSSYNALNDIGKIYNTKTNILIILLIKNLIIQSGTTGFTNDVLANATSYDIWSCISIIKKYRRKKSSTDRKRLYTSHKFYLYKTTKKDLQDKTFYQFKTKIESAGSLLSQLQIPQISHLMPMEIGKF